MSTRPARIPEGAWPPRMPADLAAGYCGEKSAGAFLRRVGGEYPEPAVSKGRRRLWLRKDLDRAMGLIANPNASLSPDELVDAAEVL